MQVLRVFQRSQYLRPDWSTEMNTMTREHRRALAAIGGWAIAVCLHSPDSGIPHLRASMMGGSQLHGWPHGTGYQCGSRGISIGGTFGHEPLFVITWPQLRAYATAIPAATRGALRDVSARGQEHQLHAPSWPPILSAAERAAYDRDVWEPWSRQGRQIRAEQVRLLRLALDLEHTEPEDLLDLLNEAAG